MGLQAGCPLWRLIMSLWIQLCVLYVLCYFRLPCFNTCQCSCGHFSVFAFSSLMYIGHAPSWVIIANRIEHQIGEKLVENFRCRSKLVTNCPKTFKTLSKCVKNLPNRISLKCLNLFLKAWNLWQNIVFNFFFSEFGTLLKDYIHDHKI